MRNNLKAGTALILWLLIIVFVALATIGTVLLVRKVNPTGNATSQIAPTSQSVSSSDEVFDIQKELDSTSFDSLDSDASQTSKDLNSI